MASFRRKPVEPAEQVKEEIHLKEEDIMLEDDVHFNEDLIDYYEEVVDKMIEEMPEEIQEEKTEEVEKPEEKEEKKEGVNMNLKEKLVAINKGNDQIVERVSKELVEFAQKENAKTGCVIVPVEAIDYVLKFISENELKVVKDKPANDVIELTVSWE